MKLYKMIILFFVALFATLILNSNFCHAATITVENEATLMSKINEASNGDTIELSADIALTKPIEITGKNLTINGKNHTITRNETNWSPNGSNGSLITASSSNTKLSLINVSLKNAQKYGIQSYNSAHIILDGVTVSGCGFGGVIANAGTVEVKNLILHKNGQTSNNGIEIAKGNGITNENAHPVLIMNGILSSSEKENVIYIATNDKLDKFEVKNTDSTVYHAFLQNNKVVITDRNNDIVFVSNEISNVTLVGDTYVKNVILTVNLMEKTVPITLKEGDKISAEQVKSKIDLSNLGLNNYTLNGFYSDKEFNTEFDFTKPITADTTIYAKLTLTETPKEPVKEKDETPKTGVTNNLPIAVSIFVISIMSVVLFKNKLKK